MYNLTNDNEIISFALELWGNYIETYCVSMSGKEMENRESVLSNKDYVAPNSLTSYQKKLVERIRYLSEQYKDSCFKCDEPTSVPCIECEQFKNSTS